MTFSLTWSMVATASALLVTAAVLILLRRERRRHGSSMREIERLAFHDSLTDLPNRLLFMDRASIAFANARRSGTSVAVGFLDLDRFKLVNDSYGHQTGDEVLRAVAARLREQLREGDTVARFGGDEFTILMAGIRTPDDVASVATKLLDGFRLPLRVGTRELVLTASIGISLYPDDASDAEKLLKSADAAMYRAKARGGDAFEVFTPGVDPGALEELALESRLRVALAREEFILYYQPRVDAANGRVVAFEALLRWDDPDRGIVSPAEFIPAAEASGLIVPIGQWVLRSACRQAREWHESGCHDVFVSVNLSQRQFHRPDLTAMILAATAEARLDPEYLELEIDESCVMGNAELSMRILQELKAIGTRVLISRFGSGYSSLRYLKSLPIDGLKLDRSFLASGESGRPLAIAAVGMAKALRLKITGEGVETPEEADFLRAHACDDLQGFLLSRPVPARDCSRIIATARIGARADSHELSH